MFRKQNRAWFMLWAFFCWTVLTFLITVLSPTVQAQQPSASPSAAIIRDSRRREMEERQWALRDLERTARKPNSQPTEERLLLFEIKTDFEMLQVVSFLLSDSVNSGPTLDYAYIKKEAAELKKRAARLKSNLNFPKPEKDDKQKAVPDSLTVENFKATVTGLEALIRSFALNPVFQQPGVVHARDSMKASSDLEEIIRRIELIRKAAETLGKVGPVGT